jgi:hypothetical protein
VIGIAWGAAVDAEVWKASGSTSNLQKVALTELLDRRLRSVERLQYNASTGAGPDGIGPSFIHRGKLRSGLESTLTLGWFDDLRHRMFEAPSLPLEIGWDEPGLGVQITQGDPPVVIGARLYTSLTHLLTDPDLGVKLLVRDASRPRYNHFSVSQADIGFWYRNFATDEYDYNIWPGTRIKPPIFMMPHPNDPNKLVPEPLQWVLAPGAIGYAWVMKPLHTTHRPSAAQVINELFTLKSLDIWERSWLHSDGVMAAIHLEALRFGMLKRHGNDEKFDI